MRWGAAGQCLLIVLSFLPVWLLRANDVPEVEPDTRDTLTIVDPASTVNAAAAYRLDVPRP